MTQQHIKVFQIYYRQEQLHRLDPAFVPHDNGGVNDPFLEYGVIKHLHLAKAAGDAELWGTVSWKFHQKTGMAGQELMDYVDAHPGYDVYYSNPSPEIESLFQNMWMHGQTTHPGFVELVQDVFSNAGLDPADCQRILPSVAFSTANYTVATPDFWADYVSFVDSVMQPAMADPQLRERLLSTGADPNAVHVGACYVPFIVERLFGAFLYTETGRRYRITKYPVPQSEAKLSVHLRRLREMKDIAWNTQSQWLASCWVSYRNLLLHSGRGTHWASEHLRDITPNTIEFGEFPVP